MTSNHLFLLNSMINTQRNKLAPDQSEPDFFEYFTVQQILKNEDLSVVSFSILKGPSISS